MRVQCVRRSVAAVCLTVGLGLTAGCGSGAGAGGEDPGGGGPAPGVSAPATAGGGGTGGGSDSGGGAEGGGGLGGDPGVEGVAPPPTDTGDNDEIEVGTDGSIGGVSDPSSLCPSPDQVDYPYCYPSTSPTDGGGQPPVADPSIGDTQPPAGDTDTPTDGAAPSPEPS